MNLFMSMMMLNLMLIGCAGTKEPITINNMTDKTLMASGYSQFADVGVMQKVNQRWLSAQQTAKLNAYRSLADQLYYEPLGNNRTVGSQVVLNEVYRVYLDTYLRNAQAIDYLTVKNSLKATLQLKLTPRFYQCMGADLADARQCLHEDDKMAFTRIGYKTATTTSNNLACGQMDCSDQLYVKGFSKDQKVVDGALLDAGFYDTEWTINSGARGLFNYLLIYGFLNAL